MEDLIAQYGSEFSYLVMAGISIPVIVSFMKKKWDHVDPRYFVIGLCGVAGLVYALGKTFIPVEVLKQLSVFGSLTWTMATALYKLQK